jgi:putative phosphoribosyl transferase
VQNRTVILVDDGLATGATMRVAAIALRKQNPQKLVAAVPVSSPQICDPYELDVDEAICAETPQPFYSVGLWYDKFEQTTDAEVKDLLNRANNQQFSIANH